jgi:acyl-CoA thioesterase II
MQKIESAWPRHPDYRIDISVFPNPVRVVHDGHCLAETRRALLVQETDHKPVLYVPEQDVNQELFQPSEHHTVCPFKGEASYRSLVIGDLVEENVLWFYPETFPEVAGIRGHVAFYDHRVRVEFDDPGPKGQGAPEVSVKRFPHWGDIEDLYRLIDVEPVGAQLYRSPPTPAFGRKIVDGQQLIAAAIAAAAKEVPSQRVSSAHLIFNRAASTLSELDFSVRTLHGGRTFSSLAVDVRQDDRLCAPGLVLLDNDAPDLIHHGAVMPAVLGPQDAVPLDMGVTGRDFRIVDGSYAGAPELTGPPEIHAWVRYREVPDAQYMHQALLAHCSGLFQIAAAMRPHAGYGQDQAHRTLSTANIAISITFHEDIQATDWILLSNVSTHASKGLTFGTGECFDQGGAHLASYNVQGMVRPLVEEAGAEQRGYERVL